VSGAVDHTRIGGHGHRGTDGGNQAVTNDDGALVDDGSGDRHDPRIRDGVRARDGALRRERRRSKERKGDERPCAGAGEHVQATSGVR
jgi:hypothetical protein